MVGCETERKGPVPHFKCVTCKTRLHDPDGTAHLVEAVCPSCGSELERAGGCAELVGFRAVTTQAQARRDAGWVDAGQSAAAQAVALPRPETTC